MHTFKRRVMTVLCLYHLSFFLFISLCRLSVPLLDDLIHVIFQRIVITNTLAASDSWDVNNSWESEQQNEKKIVQCVYTFFSRTHTSRFQYMCMHRLSAGLILTSVFIHSLKFFKYLYGNFSLGFCSPFFFHSNRFCCNILKYIGKRNWLLVTPPPPPPFGFLSFASIINIEFKWKRERETERYKINANILWS